VYFLLSGEGPTDLGICSTAGESCSGDGFQVGPLTLFVDHIVQGKHGYSPLEAGCCELVPESTLSARAAAIKSDSKRMGLPGKKRGKETRYFFNNARILSRIAAERIAQRQDEVVAILFRDSDGTASAGRGLWEDKRQSMLDGFDAEDFTRGVPMIPKPKSEAWLLCALKYKATGCAVLEGRSGNDNSPNSLKSELETHLGEAAARERLCELANDGQINCEHIDMPSYNTFKQCLEAVI
jgi:hypothetical protein